MISSRNLSKYQKILSNAYGLSENSRQFLTGLRSACVFLHGSVDADFLAENKCSMRHIQMWQEFDYKGFKLWYRVGFTTKGLTIKDPHKPNDNWNWRIENDTIDPILKDQELAVNLQPRNVYIFATIHGQSYQWIFNLAENILLGTEPCLTKVEQLNNK